VLLAHRFNGFAAPCQTCFIEQRKQARQAFAINKPENLNIGLGGGAPTRDIQRAPLKKWPCWRAASAMPRWLQGAAQCHVCFFAWQQTSNHALKSRQRTVPQLRQQTLRPSELRLGYRKRASAYGSLAVPRRSGGRIENIEAIPPDAQQSLGLIF
jgi:hypothetical protein